MKTRFKKITALRKGKGKKVGGWTESAVLREIINNIGDFGGDMYSIPGKAIVTVTVEFLKTNKR